MNMSTLYYNNNNNDDEILYFQLRIESIENRV